MKERIGNTKENYQGCLMKVVEYNKAVDIIVEFQDKYKGKVHTNYDCFLRGRVKNPYYPSVFNVGMIGDKHPSRIDNKQRKEYIAWYNMLDRCYSKKLKERRLTYKDVSCCDEWLLFENFYEWLHSQPNFDKWYKDDKWAIDKDILTKGNKVYSSETCCLIPNNVNLLFVKSNATRGNLPIGVDKQGNKYASRCNNPFTGKSEWLGMYKTIEEAFQAYKQYKEKVIKQIAEIEYSKGNIIRECYDAMMKYEIDFDD